MQACQVLVLSRIQQCAVTAVGPTLLTEASLTVDEDSILGLPRNHFVAGRAQEEELVQHQNAHQPSQNTSDTSDSFSNQQLTNLSLICGPLHYVGVDRYSLQSCLSRAVDNCLWLQMGARRCCLIRVPKPDGCSAIFFEAKIIFESSRALAKLHVHYGMVATPATGWQPG